MDIPEKRPRRRWLTCLIVLAILVGTPFLLLFGWIKIIYSLPAPPLVISKETTYVTGPLTDDGQVDYFKALEERYYPPNFATDENGYRIFVRQFGNVGEIADNEFYRLQKYEKLGLDPDIPPTLVLPNDPQNIFEDFYKTDDEDVSTIDVDSLIGRTLTRTEVEELLKTYETRGKSLLGTTPTLRKVVRGRSKTIRCLPIG